MKKFIISFGYKGFSFSARVLVRKDHGKIIISTTVIDNPLMSLLDDSNLLFIQDGKGFDLLLFKQDRSFEILQWDIRHEFLDKTKIMDVEVFSQS